MNSYWSGKKVIVTGAAGFIGSHLCDALLKAGAEVIGIDNFLSGRISNLSHLLADDELEHPHSVSQNANLRVLASQHEHFTLLVADISQPPETYLSLLPQLNEVDLVLHFASPASPPIYQAHPVATYLANSIGTHYLVQYLSRKFPKSRLVFASTSEVYGNPLVHPQTEDYWGNVNPNGLRSCYDESKRLGETICGVHFRELKYDARIVRIFNTYGPRIDLHDGRVIPDLVWQALHHEPLTIYGDGQQTRSYCYVADLVAGILAVASHSNLAGETFNLGNPGEYTINQTADMLETVMGTKLERVYKSLPADDPTRRRPDISKVQKALGWQPEVSFKEGLKLTVDYFKKLST